VVVPLNALLNVKKPLSGSRERGGDEMSLRRAVKVALEAGSA
jgi:hypothetical protein